MQGAWRLFGPAVKLICAGLERQQQYPISTLSCLAGFADTDAGVARVEGLDGLNHWPDGADFDQWSCQVFTEGFRTTLLAHFSRFALIQSNPRALAGARQDIEDAIARELACNPCADDRALDAMDAMLERARQDSVMLLGRVVCCGLCCVQYYPNTANAYPPTQPMHTIACVWGLCVEKFTVSAANCLRAGCVRGCMLRKAPGAEYCCCHFTK